jgi:hypothetical protein
MEPVSLTAAAIAILVITKAIEKTLETTFSFLFAACGKFYIVESPWFGIN